MRLSGSEPEGGSAPRDPLTLMVRVYRHILPGVQRELAAWRKVAEQIPDPELRKQALWSMTAKEFHCVGGAVYAAANLPQKHVLIPLIVAFQTISDYLDNLCDRSTSLDADDFRRLHQSMLDAVDPAAAPIDYYACRREREDGGYLRRLVERCQVGVRELPSYAVVLPLVRELVSLYCDLQVFKHLRPDQREPELLGWWEQHRGQYERLLWNEFAAATGSTLGVFALFLAATRPRLEAETALALREAYFPHVCGLHILLDYLIDQREDQEGGDLNFCSYYAGPEEAAERIARIAEKARASVGRLEHAQFHRMVVEGLLALYFSDAKAGQQPEVRRVARQLMKTSPPTRLFFWINSVWIRKTSKTVDMLPK
jgi:tetraprenyl-beta-curcumene synthase